MRRKLRGSLFPMSALGQKQTFTHRRPMSALPPKADMISAAVMSGLCHFRLIDDFVSFSAVIYWRV